MNINKFLEECAAEWEGFGNEETLALHDRPMSRDLSLLPREIQGMATENKLMLLNLAMRNLEPGEVYVEIGCWNGLTIAGAAKNNPGQIFACDDFSQFNGSSAQLKRTIKQYTAAGQVHFFDMGYLSFLARAPWQPSRIGTYFYDGGHSFEEQYQALNHVLPWLADRALVIVDDTNAGQVRAANKLFMSQVPELRLLSDIRTPGNEFPTWWNGVQIYKFESETRKDVLREQGASYTMRRLFWDGVMPPTRAAIQMTRRCIAAIPGLKPLYKRLQVGRRAQRSGS